MKPSTKGTTGGGATRDKKDTRREDSLEADDTLDGPTLVESIPDTPNRYGCGKKNWNRYVQAGAGKKDLDLHKSE
jgi:hypothetical protein